MNPPTEQLVRDYLNRVSVAARGRLSADDRRAFLARTREFIEQNTRAAGRVQTTDVLRVLADLGDPVALVSAERQRLAGGRGEPGADPPADTSLAAWAQRLRGAPANVASLLRASAAVVAPGDAPVVADPADDNPLTGDFEEIVQARRPISSRWRPGEMVTPRPPRQRRPGLPRRPRPDGPQLPADGPQLPADPLQPPGPAQSQPGPAASPTTGRSQPPAPAASPAPGRSQPPAGRPQPPAPAPEVGAAAPVRPAWPSVAARRPAAANSSAAAQDTGPADVADPVEGPGRAASAARDRAAADADQAILSTAEADRADPAAAGADSARPAASSGSETTASGSSPASITGGTPGGPPPAAPSAPADQTAAPGAAAVDSRPVAAPDGAGAAANGSTGSGSAGPAAIEAGGSGTRQDERPVTENTLIGRRPAGENAGPRVPPRGARVTWASGVRSRAMRAAGRRSGAARPGEARPGEARPGEARPGEARPGGARRGGEYGGLGEAEPGTRPGPGPELIGTAGAAAGNAARVAGRWIRRHPLESVAVVLLGLGGLIFPPVWVIGALVATGSKLWDHRDKWTGLGLPVFLVIVGIVAEVTLGGSHPHFADYVRDAWLFAGRLSRILALLGAIYLAWRAEQGPRHATAPPWKKGGPLG